MHRLAERARGMQQRDIFRVRGALHAEGAADVAGDDVQLLRLDVERAGDLAAHAADRLRGAAQRELLAGRVVARGRRARLERGHHKTLVDQFDPHHMRGVLEGAVERGLFLAVRIGGALQSKPILPGASGQSCGAAGAMASRTSVTD